MKRHKSPTVYVVMGNDYPDAVFSDHSDAEAYCHKQLKGQWGESQGESYRQLPKIYWRVYSFKLDEKVEN